VTSADITTVRTVAERCGYEGLPIAAVLQDSGTDPGTGVRILRQALQGFEYGAASVVVARSALFPESFGPAYVYLGALTRRLNGYSFLGLLDAGTGLTALVFRNQDQWTAAVWSEDGPREARIPVENATDLLLFDAANNALPAPAVSDGAAVIPASDAPVYLVGKLGSTLVHAAAFSAARSASAFLENEAFKKDLPAEVQDTVRKFVTPDPGVWARTDFLNLLKAFPLIEELWHTGKLRRAVAVPAIAQLAGLARTLAVIEQEKGEPFVEPMQSTLANCGQFQSLYLTSSSGPSETRERPDWLMNEVTRLVADAERLAEEGRLIEAGAVAVLAEWRARALQAAAKADPLTAPEVEPPPPPPADPPAEVKATEKTPDKADPPAPVKKTTSKRKRSRR